MDSATVVLVLVIAVALSSEFTNGFHDTANAMATSIGTHALPPRAAVTLSGVPNPIGAFLSVQVALTVTNAVVHIQNPDGTLRDDVVPDGGAPLLILVLAGLIGAIAWNLLTWLLGLSVDRGAVARGATRTDVRDRGRGDRQDEEDGADARAQGEQRRHGAQARPRRTEGPPCSPAIPTCTARRC